ncbi:putative Malonyl CoA-acyl carrier protein transacylase [Paraburkholderia ribeironis]|uniref:[acyl-carrier-protein] S-malonyltransferase n=1 Tax=Paraburkholderia ribeironis TaxID=1247936 RepID=A0A1N7S792_9BURK|nr:ACP S-malonyltransferase [Paraburkholderia ribeironis]SIT43199.1 putative Malonyl CoA-acyl carrier protein transacylase [Paraburkholderia ribeironis]
MRTAWVFPGHGSQYIGMGRKLVEETAAGRRWIELAENVSGLPLGKLIEKGPASEISRPEVVEPLLAAVSCAYVDWLVASSRTPAAVAGYSAGEVAAMYAASVFDAEVCMHIACLRGEALKHAAAQQQGSMMSLYGSPVAELTESLEHAESHETARIAAFNGPRHLTISGTLDGLKTVALRGLASGAQVGLIDVAGPWHTPLVESAQRRLRVELAALPFAPPRVPIWLGSEGAVCSDTARLRRSLADSVVLPVRWQAVVEGLIFAGIDAFLEVGPGHVLCGMLGQMSLPPNVKHAFLERSGSGRLRIPTHIHH